MKKLMLLLTDWSNRMKKIALFSLLTAAVAFAQQPKFEIADVHPSATAPGFAQNFGGVLREGRYVNRDATLAKSLSRGDGVPEGQRCGRPRLAVPTFSTSCRQGS